MKDDAPTSATSPASGNGEPARALPYETRSTSLLGRFRRGRRSPWVPSLVSLLICLSLFGAIAVVRANGGLQFLELKAYDLLLNRRAAAVAAKPPPPRVIVIGITESDIQNKKVQYPIADVEMAALLRTVLSYEARAIGIDIFRDQLTPKFAASAAPEDAGNGDAAPVTRPRDAATQPEQPATRKTEPGAIVSAKAQRDELLAVMQDRRVFTIVEMPSPEDPVEVRAPEGVKRSQVGFVDFPNDIDERVRRQILFSNNDEGKTFTSLAMRLALRYLAQEPTPIKPEAIPDESGKDAIRIGKTTFLPFQANDGGYVNADDGGTQALIDFRGNVEPQIVPLGDVLDGAVGKEQFAGKVVLIGMTARSVKDLLRTAIDDKTYGVAVHAITVDQLLRGALDGDAQTHVWSDGAEYGWTFAWTLLGGVLGFAVRVPWRFLTVLAAGVLALVLFVWFALVQSWWVPVVPPLLGWLAAAGFVTQYMAHHERAERSMLNDLFARLVDPDVAETLWKRRDELLDEGHLAAKEVRATLLFTDLEGFTTITEAMDKARLMNLLNDYMSVMSDVVGRTREAFVNKYIGDAIMAVFGPPLDRTAGQARDDARNAVDCALAMRAKFAEHRGRWEQMIADGVRSRLAAGETPGAVPTWAAGARPPEVTLRMRIGVQSGMVTVGSLGSSQRLEYAVIGDTVNTAARLESYDKNQMAADLAAHGCRILIGQDTLDLLPGGEYLTREVGSIRLKGKEQMVTIHGVIGRAPASRGPVTQSEPVARSVAAG